jgi:hypothetical protein
MRTSESEGGGFTRRVKYLPGISYRNFYPDFYPFVCNIVGIVTILFSLCSLRENFKCFVSH